MTNQDIAAKFNLLGKLMELNGENQFKTRSYSNAYQSLRKHPDPVMEMTQDELNQLPGIGKAIITKINQLRSTGDITDLKDLLDQTPKGIVDMIQIKGLGPQKVRKLWDGLGIDNPVELLEAIKESKVQELKGFGDKSVAALKEQIEYHLESRSKLLYAQAADITERLLKEIKEIAPKDEWSITGPLARRCDLIESIELITTVAIEITETLIEKIENLNVSGNTLFYEGFPVSILNVKKEHFIYEMEKTRSQEQFWKALKIKKANYTSSEDVFALNKLDHIIPEFREEENISFIKSYGSQGPILTEKDIRGCIHNHSTYSDGVNTMSEMFNTAYDLEYEYMVMTDHSRSAFYANGLSIERLQQQMDEIIEIDRDLDGFSCFSGIESDILSDGSLDYPDEILGELDLVIASIHSNLRMDKKKATDRLIKAIENPYTSILGHMTGRLLLSRKGYPIDHQKIIEACAANDVVIELNANPKRLDMDWRFISEAVNKGVMIAINPDAHSIKGIADMTYGVYCARKAGLPVSYCLNAMDLDDFQEWIEQQHSKRH